MATMQTPRISKPKIRLQIGDGYKFVDQVVQGNNLHTVCEEARCPNIYECWNRGTATIMILGDVCTRACGFCSVKAGRPTWNDPLEPTRTAMAVKKMKLRHVVITSVDRDDLKTDFGAQIWADTIRQIHKYVPTCTVEVLTPDFQGYLPALQKVFAAQPEIFSHNVECVERISKQVRSQANWQRSLDVLQQAVNDGLLTKTGIMVGLGETKVEVIATMEEVVDIGVKIFTIGQYLQPTKDHLPVARYVADEEFAEYKELGLKMGFSVVESGSLVRSSYHADEQARLSGVFANNE
ncbi:MAG: lipoyl synthase [Candidatus Marinimicrobia bacterium]|jgi:lipoic acid synthetase|nr:lipoyl synthase [Candidatus Neomarinimicrobiota bacterium]MDP7436414.1 lipoyl synthase [Candidatus Neomarinimicrobiota bacterium]HJL75305.1 lipoyl synthase [Candidatus Neomarinimicrobiota bacterium]|tara:strand:+ start:153 stop:1034 length:882 start_codon:yes stop_codon:yes gene_type:complete